MMSFAFSPLQRSAKTAEIIWGSRTGEMIPLYDLREIDLYAFQVLVVATLLFCHPHILLPPSASTWEPPLPHVQC